MRVEVKGQLVCLLRRHERRLPCQCMEQHAGQCVDVATAIVAATIESFGAIGERAKLVSSRGQACAVGRAGNPEVDEVDEVAPAMGGDEDVRGFDVPVDQTFVVGSVQGRCDLLGDVDCPYRVERPLRGDEDGQVRADDQRHVDEELAVDLAVVVDGDDVRRVSRAASAASRRNRRA